MFRNAFVWLKYAGAEDLPVYEITRNVCIGVNLMSASIIILNFISGFLFYWLSGSMPVLAGALLEACIIFGVILLNKSKRYATANSLFFVIILVATLYFSTILGKTSETQLMILFLFGLAYYLFRQRLTRNICITLTILLLVMLELNFLLHIIPQPTFAPLVTLLIRYLVYCVVISLALLIFYLNDRNTHLLIRLFVYSREVEISRDEKEQLNQLKNYSFRSICHDIRGSFFTLGSICTTILEKVRKNEPVTLQVAEQLVDAAEDYKSGLENNLELSQFINMSPAGLNIEPLDVKAEVERVVNRQKYDLKDKAVKVDIFTSPGFPAAVLCDKFKVRSILFNLISNAIKFTRKQTTIRIGLQCSSSSWKLSVSDQGKGISSRQLSQLYEPYVTEKSADNPEGAGIGLNVTKCYADLMGATIKVDNQPGRGATFEVTFVLEHELV